MNALARRLASLALLFAALLCACDLEIQQQTMRWRYDAAKDELHVLFLHHDIGSPKPAKSAETIVELLEGRREFMLLDWPMHVDLETDREKERAPLLVELDKRTTLVSARLGQAANGALLGSQHAVIRDWSGLLRWANGAMNDDVLSSARGAEGPGCLDAASHALWRARAERGGTWFGFDAAGFYCDFPVTPQGLARLLSELVHEAATADQAKDRAFIDQMLRCVTAFEPSADGVRMRIGKQNDTGWSVAVERAQGVTRRAELRAALKESGVALVRFDEQRAIDEWRGNAASAQR
jgi:hypothetical protein